MDSLKLAGISIDVDSVSSHLEGYGFDRPQDDGAAYTLAIPRVLEVFGATGTRATFFLIASEAACHPDVVRDIVRGGHEVASHSMTHRLPFSDLEGDDLDLEVRQSKAILEELSGQVVRGFRAPSWDLSPRLMECVVNSGYRYDASAYPSFLLPLLRRSIARRSLSGQTRTRSGLWTGVFGPTRPHQRQVAGQWLTEIPICTAPWTRLPYYHTLRFLLPTPAFACLGALARSRRGAVTYQFHAVDFMSVERDGLDPRIGRHPGMNLALEDKLELARRSLQELAPRRRLAPLAVVADAFEKSPAHLHRTQKLRTSA